MKTDAQLQTDVIAELNWDPSVHAPQVGVEVTDGIVTLLGHVSSYADKWNAERAAQRVAGVRALAMEIQVHLPGSSKRTDSDIAHAIGNILEWSSYLPKNQVKVLVEHGWVTLSGQVEWEYQRKAATAMVAHLMGVTGVSNQMGVVPRITSDAIQADIQAALKRRAQADGEHIFVQVQGTHVTLSGTVQSWSERKLANHSAWNTPGVRTVSDNLTVV